MAHNKTNSTSSTSSQQSTKPQGNQSTKPQGNQSAKQQGESPSSKPPVAGKAILVHPALFKDDLKNVSKALAAIIGEKGDFDTDAIDSKTYNGDFDTYAKDVAGKTKPKEKPTWVFTSRHPTLHTKLLARNVEVITVDPYDETTIQTPWLKLTDRKDMQKENKIEEAALAIQVANSETWKMLKDFWTNWREIASEAAQKSTSEAAQKSGDFKAEKIIHVDLLKRKDDQDINKYTAQAVWKKLAPRQTQQKK